MSDKAKNSKKSKRSVQDNEMTRVQKLERENELLRLEVEYLSGRLSRRAQAALSFELKEEFRLKDVLTERT